MRIDWIKTETETGCCLFFFNGWGMDVQAIAHLSSSYDLAVCSDYHSLETGKEAILFSNYHTVYVVAWSWACGLQPIRFRTGRYSRISVLP